MLPLFPPLQDTFVITGFGTKGGGSVRTTVTIVVQGAASITCMLYVPAQSPATEVVVCPPGVQRMLYGAVPPDGETEINPLQSLLQTGLICAVTVRDNVLMLLTAMDIVLEHPAASVMVTVYIPAGIAVMQEVVGPVDQA